MTVRPTFLSSATIWRILSWLAKSNPVTGSSSRMSGASRARAWATITRWHWPADSASIWVPSSPSTSSRPAARSIASWSRATRRRGITPGANRAIRRTSRTVRGSHGRRPPWLTRETTDGRPTTAPRSTGRSPARTSRRVVLPDPFGPTRAVAEPAGKATVTSRRATTPPRLTETLSTRSVAGPDMGIILADHRGDRTPAQRSRGGPWHLRLRSGTGTRSSPGVASLEKNHGPRPPHRPRRQDAWPLRQISAGRSGHHPPY